VSILFVLAEERSAMDRMDSLVEATITAFWFDRAKHEMRVEVACVWEDKGKKRIVASGIDKFLIDDMGPYNIIDRVNLYGAEDSMDEKSECAACLFFLMQKKELTASDMEWPGFKEKLFLIRDGKLSLMEIEPVYGASFIVLAESIRLETIVD
jgi:hypothetical protein